MTVVATNAIGTGPGRSADVVPRPAVLTGSGSQLWLDATDPDGDGTIEGPDEHCDPATGCASASNVLTRWEDKSGSGNDAVQTTGSMAGRYVPLAPAVNFDANGFLTTTVQSGPDLTAFVVAQSDTTTWNTWGWLLSSRRPNGLIIHPSPGSTSVGWYATNSAGAWLAPTTVAPGSITGPRIYELAQTGSNPIVATASLDGNVLGTQTLAGQTRTAGPVPLLLGADDCCGSRFGDGRYREVVVFSRTLTTAEQRAVQEYLARKWSIPITPAAPTGVTTLAANGGALVSWTAPVDDGGSPVTGSVVAAWPGGAGCTATAPATSCTVTGLTNGTTYVFVVAAQNALGTGPASSPSANTTPGPPPAPTAPSATRSSRQVTVSWTAPVLAGHAPLTGYTVTATAAGQPSRTCTTTGATTCTVTGLANDVTYTFAVTAANAHGDSPAATVTATPAWDPPVLGSALTWWFDASDPAALTGTWVARAGVTVTGSAGSTRLQASSGVVERIDIVTGGTDYTTAPTLTINGGGGSGASVINTTVSGGAVISTMVRVRGSGFTGAPTVTVTGGGGTGASLEARIVAPIPVGASIRIGGTVHTVVDRDGLVLTVSPPLVANATAAAVEEWRVSSWQNRATPGTYDGRQTNAAERPHLGTMAGRPAVVFSGWDSWMSILDDTGTQRFDHGPTWTMLIAAQAERQTAYGAVAQTGTGANTRIIASSSHTGQADWQSAENVQVNPNTANDALNSGPVRVITVSGNGADTFDWSRVFLGATAAPSYSDGWGFAGRIGEIVFVNAGLDSTAVADAQAYLSAKWVQPAAVPSAPIDVRAAAGDAQAVVTWRGSNHYLAASITSYTVTATAPGQATRTCTTAALSCTLTGLANGAPYSVTVTASSSAGAGVPSLPLTVVTRPAILTGANTRLWLDGTDLDGDGRVEGPWAEAASTGGAVAVWNDKSGRSNHVSAPSVAEQPLATTRTLNGLPVVTFDGQQILRGTPAANPYAITGDRTLFVVTRRRSGSPSRLVDRAPEDNPLFNITGNNTLEVRDDNGGQYQPSIGTIGSAVDVPYVLAALRSGTALAIWSNAAASGTGTITGTQTQRALTIGRHVAWSQASDHDVAEVILFDRALTAAERRQVETYLRLKWGIALVPTAPTNAVATQLNGTVTVSWTASTDDGGSPITGYTVTASPGGATCTTTGTSCTVPGLAGGTTYTFTVRATNAAGNSAESAPTGSITRSFIVGSVSTPAPYHAVFDGNHVWITNRDQDTVSRIDPTTGATVATVVVGDMPTDLATDGTSVWVTNYNSGNVSRINIATNSVVATIATGGRPHGAVWNGTDVWVSNNRDDQVHRISTVTNTIIDEINRGNNPYDIEYEFGAVWMVRNEGGGRVARIDPATGSVTHNVSVGSDPTNLVSDGTSLWVVNSTSSSLSRINPSTRTVTATVALPAGSLPYDVVFGDGRLWVSLRATDQVVMVDPATLTVSAPIAVGDEPRGLLYVAATNRVWVMNRLGNTALQLAR